MAIIPTSRNAPLIPLDRLCPDIFYCIAKVGNLDAKNASNFSIAFKGISEANQFSWQDDFEKSIWKAFVENRNITPIDNLSYYETSKLVIIILNPAPPLYFYPKVESLIRKSQKNIKFDQRKESQRTYQLTPMACHYREIMQKIKFLLRLNQLPIAEVKIEAFPEPSYVSQSSNSRKGCHLKEKCKALMYFARALSEAGRIDDAMGAIENIGIKDIRKKALFFLVEKLCKSQDFENIQKIVNKYFNGWKDCLLLKNRGFEKAEQELNEAEDSYSIEDLKRLFCGAAFFELSEMRGLSAEEIESTIKEVMLKEEVILNDENKHLDLNEILATVSIDVLFDELKKIFMKQS
ncbi:MAG: hypothetical protein K1060chlam1_01456 [Candidatus Anoxychlamydiales bacterium]|nr:hypothetical protein [Candidatus Anoxychlamydiales bacterium]